MNIDALKIYTAGMCNATSSFSKKWQRALTSELEKKLRITITLLDPTQYGEDWSIVEASHELVIGRTAYFISQADLVVLNLAESLDVSALSELLAANQQNKQVVGFGQLPIESFSTDPFDLFWLQGCSTIVADWDGLAQHIRAQILTLTKPASVLDHLPKCLETYKQRFLAQDSVATALASQ